MRSQKSLKSFCRNLLLFKTCWIVRIGNSLYDSIVEIWDISCPFWIFTLILYLTTLSFLCWPAFGNKLKKCLLTTVKGAQHPNTGQNISQLLQCNYCIQYKRIGDQFIWKHCWHMRFFLALLYLNFASVFTNDLCVFLFIIRKALVKW